MSLSDNNLLDVPSDVPEELSTLLLKADEIRIERIVSHGHMSPEGFWYDQDEHEWVMVLRGAAKLQIEDDLIELKPGDYINIPAHRRHRVEWTTPDKPTVWLAVFYR